MQHNRSNHLFAVFFSVALHAMLLALVSNYQFRFSGKPEIPKEEQIIFMEVLPPPPKENLPEPVNPPAAPDPSPATALSLHVPQDSQDTTPVMERKPASMAAPSPPTAEEWAFAAKYTNKNSKGYRYSWGQQVRSMMGTAVDGPEQGMVRFQVEIAPDGRLIRLDTLWTTSAVVEQLARKAIENMPPLPPTPTGKPLIFERTISFTPFASDGPPLYRDDCLPAPPMFRNPFAWDGRSAQVREETPPVEKLDPQALEECVRQLPQDSIEAEMAHDQRILDQWGQTELAR